MTITGIVSAHSAPVAPQPVATDRTIAVLPAASAGNARAVKEIRGGRRHLAEGQGATPQAVAGLTVAETQQPGIVKISWNPVTLDGDGNPIDTASLRYYVYRFDSEGNLVKLNEEGLTETSYTFRAVDADRQIMVQYAVIATNSTGPGEPAVTETIPVGKPYDTFRASFKDGELPEDYVLGIGSNEFTSWGLYNDDSGVVSQDFDNGFVGMQGSYENDWGELFTGKIDLRSMSHPELVFYTYNISGEEADRNTVRVFVRRPGSGYEELLTGSVDELCGGREGWSRVTVSLDGFSSDVVQLKLRGEIGNYRGIFFDNLTVAGRTEHNLRAMEITAPSIVKAGEGYNVDVKVFNSGSVAATGWSVELLSDDVIIASKECDALAADETVTVSIPAVMDRLATEPLTLEAHVVYDADADLSDNLTAQVTVIPEVSPLPRVEALSATITDGGVVLSWNAPDMASASAMPMTEDFESRDESNLSYGDWTFIDGDGEPVGGIGTDIPGIIDGETPASFFLFDTEEIELDEELAMDCLPHSGSNFLGSLFTGDGAAVDDWAISPRLSGKAQIISFYAKSFIDVFPDAVEVLYTTSDGTDAASFITAQEAQYVPGEWTLYTVALPEDARRFALRSCSQEGYMLMIDDVTYTPEGSLQGVELTGYNVYRDGELLNEAPIAETSFLDTEALSGEHRYTVTALFSAGESAGTHVVSRIAVGISRPGAARVSTRPGMIVVTGAEDTGMTVFTLDGLTVFSGSCRAGQTVSVAPGIYVINLGGKVYKVAVSK